MRIFLSYHTPDRKAALALKHAIEAQDASVSVFVDQSSLRLGSFWLPKLGEAIRDSDAFVMLVGNRLGDWQKIEYYEALDRKAKQEQFPIVPVITVERPPNLPFISQLHWIAAAEPDAPEPLGRVLAAIKGADIPPAVEPWRTVNPYRGLLALEEEDADFFYGRDQETAEILQAVMAHPEKLVALIGNSGVGKSSLVQAGVIGALKRQRWPRGSATAVPPWPEALRRSRLWCYITIKPGADPIGALAGAFAALWFEGATNPEVIAQRRRWAELLQSGQASLADLIDTTEKRFRDELGIGAPPRIFVYIDQGEELYACEPATVAQFSRLLAAGLRDERLIAVTTQRSDTYGQLQANDDLFPIAMRIDVAAVGQDALRSVLVEPARIFGARYESPQLVEQILKQAQGRRGALPLVADFMEDLWLEMQRRQDGVIRAFREDRPFLLGGNLVERCELFMQKHATQEAAIKKLFTQKLMRVYEVGDPVAYHLTRSEATDEEWGIVQSLASPSWRLVIISDQGGEPRAEVMHDVLLQQWPRLQSWVTDERHLAIWRTRVESSYQLWKQASWGGRTTLLLGEYVLNEITANDSTCKVALHKGLAEYIHASAVRRSSWWQVTLGYYRETFSALTRKKLLIALGGFIGGVVVLAVVLGVLKGANLVDDEQGGAIGAIGGGLIGLGVMLFLYRSPHRSRYARMARNLKREFLFAPVGIGGYLVVFIVVFVFMLVNQLELLVTFAHQFYSMTVPDLMNVGSPTRSFSAAVAGIYVGRITLLVLGIAALIAIFRRRPAARSLAIAFLVAALILAAGQGLFILWVVKVWLIEMKPTVADGIALLGTAVICIIGVLYFLFSERVRATFARA